MPEFEHKDPQPDPSHAYTPSEDASAKRKTRRRSGGFKSDPEPGSAPPMGEIDPTEALEAERLPARRAPASKADAPKPAPPASQPSEPPAESRPSEATGAANAPAGSAAKGPTAETLAAIQRVEGRIEKRRAARERRRRNAPEKGKRQDGKPRHAAGRNGDSKPEQPAAGGVLAAIGNFFGGLFGSGKQPATEKKHEPSKPTARQGPRQPNRSGKGQGKGAHRHGGGPRRSGGGPRRRQHKADKR